MSKPPTPDWVLAPGAQAMEKAHRALLAATGGRLGQRFGRNQTVEIHTIGRNTKQRHSTLLTAPIYTSGRFVLVASKGGSSDHPDWYKNLAAYPDIEGTVEGVNRRYRARTASSQEKRDLWPQILQAFPGYEGYQRNTTRDIPVVICETGSR
ncbi:nitroreductase/quinone reductase family protein [Mycobacteroides abscessus]|nr:nitroreductase/quinone reductase family protein [Mycobacteroides abscessus]